MKEFIKTKANESKTDISEYKIMNRLEQQTQQQEEEKKEQQQQQQQQQQQKQQQQQQQHQQQQHEQQDHLEQDPLESSPVETIATDQNPIVPKTLPRPDKSPCNVCHEDPELENSLTCTTCANLVHFHCTRLPPYMLYVFTTGKRAYLCEVCAKVPETFLFQLISNRGTSLGSSTEEKEDDINQHVLDRSKDGDIAREDSFADMECTNHRTSDHLEKDISTLVEKYGIPSAEGRSQNDYNFEKINDELLTDLNLMSSGNKLSIFHDELAPQERKSIIQETLKSAESALSLSETEKFISSLSKGPLASSLFPKVKCQHTNLMYEMNSNIQSLQNKLNDFGSKSPDLEAVLAEKRMLEDQLNELRLHSKEKEYLIKSLLQGVESKQNIINIITTQLKEANERNRGLETNLSLALEKMNNYDDESRQKRSKVSESKASVVNAGNRNAALEAEEETRKDTVRESARPTGRESGNEVRHNDPQVIFFHDSLCKNVNETILSKEGVATAKMYAPTLHAVLEKLDEVKKVDLIVLQSFLESVKTMPVDEVMRLTAEIVKKCLLISKKVVISSIVKISDDSNIGSKIDLIMSSLKLVFLNSKDVLICNNENLNDSRYRVDNSSGDALTTHGTALLATNLKYKMAEALGINVIKKRKDLSRISRNNRNAGSNARLSA